MYAYLKMEMTETCGECPFNVWSEDHEHFCVVRTDIRSFDGSAIWRVKHCPLIEVPDPHGRLIDADALKEAFCGNCFADENPMECSEPCMDMRIILEAPTVIPADESDMDSFIRIFEEDDEEDGMDSFIRILKD